MVIRAGLRLGGFAFLAGLCAGPLRELVLAPRIGGVPAAWLELFVLVPVLAWIAWRCLPPGLTPPRRAAIAGLALGGALLCEVALGLAFQASGLANTRAPRGLAEQVPGMLMLAWLAALPFLVRR